MRSPQSSFIIRLVYTLLLCLLVFAADGQEQTASPFSWAVYAELYYGYDFTKPVDNNRPSFVYNHNRHNEVNLNLGFVRGTYATNRVRANLAFAAGTYVNANYVSESGVLKNVFEANAGLRLSKKINLWFDVGIFGSHLGFESAIGKDCANLTRSMGAENSPYYETGARINYQTRDNKWLFSILALNGWQRITRLPGNSLLSVGTQLQFKPNEQWLFNFSTFTGTDTPDSARLIRTFHDMYGKVKLDKLGISAGFDIG